MHDSLCRPTFCFVLLVEVKPAGGRAGACVHANEQSCMSTEEKRDSKVSRQMQPSVRVVASVPNASLVSIHPFSFTGLSLYISNEKLFK